MAVSHSITRCGGVIAVSRALATLLAEDGVGDIGRIVPTNCGRPRRGHYSPGAHAHPTPQRDNVAHLSYSVSSRSEDVAQYILSVLVDRPLSHVTVT
jgi:hypothetical protein